MINPRDHVIPSGTRVASQAIWFLADGFYIWEFIMTLGFEWDVIRGHRPHRWTIWIYSLTRLATLGFVAGNILSLVAPIPIDCQTVIGVQFILSYVAVAATSLMIVLRVIAIWNKNKIIVAIATLIWVTNLGLLIQGATRFHSSWDWGIEDCVFYVESVRLSTVSAFVTDMSLLLMMLFGLCRLRHQGGLMALGRLLWNQGFVWLLVAIFAELTPTVFISLDVTGPLRIMFMIPWVIAISIAATRMYRSLSDFLSSEGSYVSGSSQKSLPKNRRTTLKKSGTPTSPIFFAGAQVAAHNAHEQPYTSQESYSGTDITEQSYVNPHELTGVGLAGDHDSMESGSKRESWEV